MFLCVRCGLRVRFRFNLQPQLAQQRNIDIGRRIFRGEKFVAVKNRICAGKKTKRLAFARNPGATGGQSDTRFRQRDARDAD